MILVDYSQLCISNLMQQLSGSATSEIDVNFLRHMILNSIRTVNMKFKDEYGKLIFACDCSSKKYWRKQVFPYYKANRKKTIDNSKLDWNAIFAGLDLIKAELKAVFPYPFIEVDGAEADDVIATIINIHGTLLNYGDSILIISGDQDFKEFQRYGNVKQYNWTGKKFVTCDSPTLYLKEKIMRGDVGDGVPNFLSPDNVFVTDNKRQFSLTKKKMEEWLKKEPEDFCDTNMLRNFHRNQMLIDLSFIPKEITEKIMDEYNNQKEKKASNLLNYFIKNKLKLLMDSINDFR